MVRKLLFSLVMVVLGPVMGLQSLGTLLGAFMGMGLGLPLMVMGMVMGMGTQLESRLGTCMGRNQT